MGTETFIGLTVAEWIGAASVATGVGSAVQQSKAAGTAARSQRRQLESQKAMQDAEIRKQRLEARRRARAASATIQASGEAAGVGGSSAVAGGVASVGTQLAGQESYLTQQSYNQNAFLAAQMSETKAKEQQNLWQTVGTISSAVGTRYGKF